MSPGPRISVITRLQCIIITKQHPVVSIQANVVACPTYPEKFIRDDVVASFVRTSNVIVTLPGYNRTFSRRETLYVYYCFPGRDVIGGGGRVATVDWRRAAPGKLWGAESDDTYKLNAWRD